MNRQDIIQRFLKVPPNEWEALAEGILRNISPSQADDLRRLMEDEAERLCYLAEYIANRSGAATCGDRRNHADAAKAARKRMVRVSRALGYTYPDRRAFNL